MIGVQPDVVVSSPLKQGRLIMRVAPIAFSLIALVHLGCAASSGGRSSKTDASASTTTGTAGTGTTDGTAATGTDGTTTTDTTTTDTTTTDTGGATTGDGDTSGTDGTAGDSTGTDETGTTGGGTDETGTTGGGTDETGTTGGGTDETGTTGGTGGDAECLNDADLEIIGSNDVQGQATSCGLECIGQDISCTESCVMEVTGLSTGCTGCYAAIIQCTITSCAGACAANPSSNDCVACMVESGCVTDYQTCSGIDFQTGMPIDGGTTTGGDGECMTANDCADGEECIDGFCGTAGGTTGGTTGDTGVDCGAVSFEGCCEGDTLKYCDRGLQQGDCAEGGCGWEDTVGYYSCEGDGADPSGANPLACP
ncbi:MAG: hypothetical protein ACI9WU_003674 [Myxococcota bacterium]|jgi:hypothetical protein